MRQGIAGTVHFVVAMENTTQIHGAMCFTNTDKNKTFPQNQNVTCASYGVYVATCVIRHQQNDWATYKQIFHTWSLQRSNWTEYKDDNEQMALWRHYSVFNHIINKQPIREDSAFTFVEQPSFHSLDIYEDEWGHKLDAQINIQSMILPNVK